MSSGFRCHHIKCLFYKVQVGLQDSGVITENEPSKLQAGLQNRGSITENEPSKSQEGLQDPGVVT